MRRRDARRQNNAVVVAVRHDHCAHHASSHAPARGPAKLLFALARLELDPAGASEVLPEEMRCASLDRLAVLHHRFEREGFHRTRELFAVRF